jgi:hypothetical protein
LHLPIGFRDGNVNLHVHLQSKYIYIYIYIYIYLEGREEKYVIVMTQTNIIDVLIKLLHGGGGSK